MPEEENQRPSADYQPHIEDKIGAFIVLTILLVVVAGFLGLGVGGGRYSLAIVIGAVLVVLWLCVKIIKKN